MNFSSDTYQVMCVWDMLPLGADLAQVDSISAAPGLAKLRT